MPGPQPEHRWRCETCKMSIGADDAPEALIELWDAAHTEHGHQIVEEHLVDGQYVAVGYLCPCRRCPRCGLINQDPDSEYPHPEDGLASCSRCRNEWWATVGPYMDGRHPASRAEEDEWDAHDAAILEAGR